MEILSIVQALPQVPIITQTAQPSSAWPVWNIIQGIGIVTIAGMLIYIGRKLQILDSLQETLGKVKVNLKVVTDFLIGQDLPFDHEKLQAYSPTQLTAQGRTYLETTGFVEVFTNHSQDFYSCIEREHPANDYDIENASIRSVISLFNSNNFAPIKDHFYNHPNEDKRAFMRVAGIYVRDQYKTWKATQNC